MGLCDGRRGSSGNGNGDVSIGMAMRLAHGNDTPPMLPPLNSPFSDRTTLVCDDAFVVLHFPRPIEPGMTPRNSGLPPALIVSVLLLALLPFLVFAINSVASAIWLATGH